MGSVDKGEGQPGEARRHKEQLLLEHKQEGLLNRDKEGGGDRHNPFPYLQASLQKEGLQDGEDKGREEGKEVWPGEDKEEGRLKLQKDKKETQGKEKK